MYVNRKNIIEPKWDKTGTKLELNQFSSKTKLELNQN